MQKERGDFPVPSIAVKGHSKFSGKEHTNNIRAVGKGKGRFALKKR